MKRCPTGIPFHEDPIYGGLPFHYFIDPGAVNERAL